VHRKDQSRRDKVLRRLTIPSPSVWGEITRRYYFSETGEEAPKCPGVLMGKKFILQSGYESGGRGPLSITDYIDPSAEKMVPSEI